MFLGLIVNARFHFTFATFKRCQHKRDIMIASHAEGKIHCVDLFTHEADEYSKQNTILAWYKQNDISNVILSEKLISFFMLFCLFRHDVVCLALQTK